MLTKRQRTKRLLATWRTLGMLAVVGCLLGLCLVPAGPGVAQATSRPAARLEQSSAKAIAESAGPGHVDSGVVSWDRSAWLATAVGRDEAAAEREPTSAIVDVQVFHWINGAWAVQGVVSLADLGGPPPTELHVSAVALAGLSGPNFEVSATQYGITFAAVIAAVDGSWRAVPFAPSGWGSDTVIGGTVNGGRVGRVTTVCAPCTVEPAPTEWYQYEGGAFTPSAEPGPPPPCHLAALPGRTGSVAGYGVQVVYTKVSCQDGFALATGAQGGHQVAVLFQRIGTTWSRLAGSDQIDWAASQYGLKLSVLHDLAAHVGPAARPAVAAASIFGHDAAIATNSPPYPATDSAVVERDNAQWFAAAGKTAGPRTGFVASIYRWDGAAWAKVGSAPLQLPDLNGPGSIIAVSLTGSRQPDFLITGSGADWQPASVVSDIGGTWHAVPFDYGAGLTTLVDEGRTQGPLVETRNNACGCASGPESYLWEAYSAGAFRPVNPPGPKPACSASSLSLALDEMSPLGGSPPLAFKRAACADGWAMAAGTGDAYTGPVMGLFEQLGGQWHNLQLDDGADLAYEVGLYDIPVSLFVQLGAELGPTVAAQVSAAWPPVRLGLPAGAAVSSLLVADGSQWLVAASMPEQRNSDSSAWVTITVLRWTGLRWSRVGQVDRLPDKGNIVGEGQWYAVVTVPGTALPGFRLSNFTDFTGQNWTVVVGYRDGSWRVISKLDA